MLQSVSISIIVLVLFLRITVDGLRNAVLLPQQRAASSSSSSRGLQHNPWARNDNKWQQQQQQQAIQLRGAVNGDDGTDAPPPGSVVPMASTAKSQLASAFSALDQTDQYDAVLTGLCAKMLDTTSSSGDDTEQKLSLDDPVQLLQEMNDRRIEASPRSLMALIDASVKTQDDKSMAQVLSLCSKNPFGINQYGALQQSIIPLPALQIEQQPAGGAFRFTSSNNNDMKVLCPDGTRKTRQERLDSVPDIPTDDRSTEVASALVVLSLFGVDGVTNVFGMEDIAPFINAITFLITTVGVVDNFYDVLTWGTKFAGGIIADKEKEKKSPTSIGENMKLPEKDSLPLGLGTGTVTGTVVRGFSRLVSVDTERECECEAAALYAGYALGLPCFAFRPNALEAACLIADSVQENDGSSSSSSSSRALDPLLSNFGVLKVLTWLMSPVAMEGMKHAQLINSDPREAEGFLQRLVEKDYLKTKTSDDILWLLDDVLDPELKEKEKQDLIKWAYTEADVLLRNNMDDVKLISQQLSGGAATIGDCVATIEKW